MENNHHDFQDLPEVIRTGVARALLHFRPEIITELPELEKKEINIFLLVGLFPWQKTEEGFCYWQGVNLECPRIKIKLTDLC